jgi:hypothetical protein
MPMAILLGPPQAFRGRHEHEGPASEPPTAYDDTPAGASCS